MTIDIERIFMCLWAICVSSLEKDLLKSVLNWVVFLLSNFKSSLYILNTSLLSNTQFINIFSDSVGRPSTFLTVSFDAQKFSIFYSGRAARHVGS